MRLEKTKILVGEDDKHNIYTPVPFPRVKSPPWHMKSGITRWKDDPLKCRGFPDLPMPLSPVQRHRKFSAVRGTTSARSWTGRRGRKVQICGGPRAELGTVSYVGALSV